VACLLSARRAGIIARLRAYDEDFHA
jgi:hypothetical protein